MTSIRPADSGLPDAVRAAAPPPDSIPSKQPAN